MASLKTWQMLTALAVSAVLAAPACADRKKVLVVINEGFNPEEYNRPLDQFNRAGFDVTVAARRVGSIKPSSDSANAESVDATLTFEQVDVSKYDGFSFVGGAGAWGDYFGNDAVHKIVRDAMERHKTLGLLGDSAGLLATTDNYDGAHPIAEGRHVTGYYKVAGMLKALGKVNYDAGETGKPCVITDGNLVTARDPMSSSTYAQLMVRRIRGQ